MADHGGAHRARLPPRGRGRPALPRARDLAAALLGVALWVVCLNGGTLALNSAFDRDEGDVAYLRSPPPPPRGPRGVPPGPDGGRAAAGAVLLPPRYQVAYAACFVLSVLYSVPPVRLKAVAGADWLINMVGFGTLTPYAGWAATGLPLDAGARLVLLAFCPLFAALYPLTQLYQLEEDARRGDRTLAPCWACGRSLDAAIAALVVAFALFAGAGSPRAGGWAESLALAVLALALARLGSRCSCPGARDAGRMAPADHQRGMYRALGAWAVTDVAVLLAWGA